MLEMAAEKSIPYDIKDEAKLRAVAGSLGLETEGKDKFELAKELAKALCSDFAPGKETMDFLKATAPAERVETWRKLGILPKDPDLEIRRIMHETTMGCDADPVNLLLNTAKMGLVDCYSGLKLGTDVQDIVFGTPMPVKTEANLGVLSKDKVNIVIHGHIPFLSEKIVEWARRLEDEAKAAGAAGIVGCNNPRFPQDSVIVPLAKELLKNNVLIVVTGCVAHALGKAGLMSPEGAEKYAGPGLLAVLRAVGEAAGLGGPLPPVLHMGSCVDNSRIGDLLGALAGYLGVSVSQLPVAASAPELNHEKALSIGTWAVDLGLFTHIGMAPFVLGSPVVTKVLTEDIEGLVGGKFYVEPDPIKAAEAMVAHIRKKREALGI